MSSLLILLLLLSSKKKLSASSLPSCHMCVTCHSTLDPSHSNFWSAVHCPFGLQQSSFPNKIISIHTPTAVHHHGAGWNKVDGNVFSNSNGGLGGGMMPRCGYCHLSSNHLLRRRGNGGGRIASDMSPWPCGRCCCHHLFLFSPSHHHEGGIKGKTDDAPHPPPPCTTIAVPLQKGLSL